MVTSPAVTPALTLDQPDMATVNDNLPHNNVTDQDRIEARLAAFGYLCDSRSLYGNEGRDTYYLVGNTEYRIIWCRRNAEPDLTVEHLIDDQWRVLWRGCALGFLCDGPDADKISPVKPRLRKLGQIMESMRLEGAKTRCQWDGDADQATLSLTVISDKVDTNGHQLVIKPTTGRVCMVVNKQPVATLSLTESFGNLDDEFARRDFESFLKSQPHASSDRSVGKTWKTLRENVVTFLSNR